MATVVFRRGKWLVDYRDVNGTRRWLAVEGGRDQAAAELSRLSAAGELWTPTKKRTRLEVVRDQQLEEESRVRPQDREYQSHGLRKLRNAVEELAARGLSPIDEATEPGRALAQWRSDLIRDLGGEEAVSAQEKYVIELVTRLRLMVDSIDGWLLSQPSLVNKLRRQVYSVVLERTRLADSIVKNLELLGLKRRAREALTLADYLQARESNP